MYDKKNEKTQTIEKHIRNFREIFINFIIKIT